MDEQTPMDIPAFRVWLRDGLLEGKHPALHGTYAFQQIDTTPDGWRHKWLVFDPTDPGKLPTIDSYGKDQIETLLDEAMKLCEG